MSFLAKLRNLLYEPELANLNVDDNKLMSVHREILLKKPLLYSAFKTFYNDMSECCDKYLDTSGLEVELGSGVGFFNKIRTNILTSDIRKAQHIDRVLDATALDLQDASVRCIFAINVFHHLDNPDKFLSELSRVLKKGGGCILIEPHIGFGSRLLHRFLHKDESFIPDAPNWHNNNIKGPMSGANQALSYIVFKRDYQLFHEKYGDQLEIVCKSYPLNSLRYFFSGGLNFRQLLPSKSESFLKYLEKTGKTFARHWAFHQLIVLRRINDKL